MEIETGKQVFNILQLRHHESIVSLKKMVTNELKDNPNKIYDIDLTYLTSRGNWYLRSWKGNLEKSGGVATNIEFIFLICFLGYLEEYDENIVHLRAEDTNSGFLRFKNAEVSWFLSTNAKYIPRKF